MVIFLGTIFQGEIFWGEIFTELFSIYNRADRLYGSRISADCQQKLLFKKYDTSGRFLLVTFFEKREEGTQK